MLHAFLLTQSGIPVLYSGDEIGQLNDYGYHNDPVKCDDSRYLHRGDFNWDSAKCRKKRGTRQWQLFSAITKLVKIRKQHKVFDSAADAWIVETHNDNILGIGRYYDGEKMIALFNFGDYDAVAYINEEGNYKNLLTRRRFDAKNVTVPAHDFLWLAY